MENEEHPVYSLLQQKLNEIEQELAKADILDEVRERLYIWKDLFTYVNAILYSKRFPRVPKRILTDLQNNISSFNINIAHNPRLTNTVLLYDGIVAAAQKIPVLIDKGTLGKKLTSLVDSFNNQANSSVLNFANERKQAIEDWTKEKVLLQQDVKKLQDERKTLLDQIETLKADITTQRNANQRMVSELQLNFTNFKKAKDEEFKTQKEALDKKIVNLETSSTAKADEIIKALKTKEAEVEKLWGIIGKAVVSGQAQSYADKAQKMANILMWTAFTILIGLTLGLVVITMIDIYQQKFSFLTFCYKVMASAVLLAPAIYCMNLAKRQRDREFQLRDFEVKTTALEPFLERMEFTSDDQKSAKDTVKLELAKAFFDTEFAKENKQHGAILLSADMIDGLAKLGDIFNSQRSEGK